MKRPIIVRTKNVHSKVEVFKAVNRISNNIRAGKSDYEIGMFSVILVDEYEYQIARKELRVDQKKVIERSLKDYPEGGFKNEGEKAAFYSEGFITLDEGPAFWVMPINDVKLPFGLELKAETSYIFLCPSKVEERSLDIRRRMFDHQDESLFTATLRVALLHELGHHFLYSFLPAAERKKITNGEDLVMSEGLANWFAYNLSTELERHILAELMVERSIAYRSYLEIRYMNPSEVLRNLRDVKDYLKALNSFAIMIGGRMEGGFNLDSQGDIISKGTVFMDDSITLGEMWNVICRGRITHLGPLWGYVIAPDVDILVGRLPNMTLLVTNKVGSHPDYGELPVENIFIRDREEILDAIAKTPIMPGISPQQRMMGLLAQLRVDNKWIRQLLHYESQLKK